MAITILENKASDRTAYLSTLSGLDRREDLANIEAEGHVSDT